MFTVYTFLLFKNPMNWVSLHLRILLGNSGSCATFYAIKIQDKSDSSIKQGSGE